MATIRKSITIHAPIDQVFAYLTDPEHLPEIWPSMVEVKNARHAPDGTQSFDWTYKMAGLRFHGHSESIEARPNEQVVVKNDGIPSTFRWNYLSQGADTTVSLEVDYEIPGSALNKLARPILAKINEREAEHLLENLKSRMEIRA